MKVIKVQLQLYEHTCMHTQTSFLTWKQTHTHPRGLKYSNKSETIKIRWTHTCTHRALRKRARAGQTAAEESHHLTYNITDTWQIPQHYVSKHNYNTRLTHFVSSPRWCEHTLEVYIKTHTFFLCSVNKLPIDTQKINSMQSHIYLVGEKVMTENRKFCQVRGMRSEKENLQVNIFCSLVWVYHY